MHDCEVKYNFTTMDDEDCLPVLTEKSRLQLLREAYSSLLQQQEDRVFFKHFTQIHQEQCHLSCPKVRELKASLHGPQDETINVCECLDHIKYQLEACANFRDDLERSLSPDASNPPEVSASGDRDAFILSRTSERTTRQRVEACDVDPEDEVLEDIAFGEDSIHEGQHLMDGLELDDNLMEASNSLHPSVLRELSLAIRVRRVDTEARERRALAKRGGHTDDPVAKDSVNLKSSCAPEIASETDPDPSISSSGRVLPDPDEALESFFSLPTLKTTSTHCSVKPRVRLHGRLAMNRRVKQFSQFRPTSKMNGGIPIVAMTTNMTPHMETKDTPLSVPLRRCLPVPGANPILNDLTFTMALLAQRKKLGYAEEKFFTGAADTEDVDDHVELYATDVSV